MNNRRHLGAILAALLPMGAVICSPHAASAQEAQRSTELPTLDRAIELARQRAIVVADAQAEVGVARASMLGARVSAIGNPYVDFQVEKGLSRTTELSTQAIAYAYFPVDLTGQRGARIEEADKLIKWREMGLVDARGVATGEVVTAYGEMLLGSARIKQASNGEQVARDEAKYFTGRLVARDTTIYETSLAEAEVARWIQSRAEAQLRLSAARARFAQLTGAVDVTAPPGEIVVAPPQLRSTWDDAFIASAVGRAPLVARLNAEKTYWDASVERYKSERMPPVAFELIGGRGELGEARVGGGVVLTFPVTRRNQGEIARAEQGRLQALNRLELYRSIVLSRLRVARDAYLTVTQVVDELDKAGMPALERAVSASVEGFKMGKIEMTRVLLARRDLALAHARRLDLIEAGWRAYADLTVLSGALP